MLPDLTALPLPELLRLYGEAGGTQDGAGAPDAGAGGLPEPPTFDAPSLLQAPAPGFRERLAVGLTGQPGYTPQPFEGGASRFGRGLLAGAARGFSGGTLLGMKQKQAETDAANTAARTAADRANALKLEGYRARLTDHYKTLADARGKVTVTKAQAEASGLPEGTLVEPRELATATAQHAAGKRLDAALAETQRHNRVTETRGGIGGNMTPEALDATVKTILQGIAQGTLSPEIEKYASRDGRLRNALAVGAVDRGIDLATLRQSWVANNRGLSTANSPQQLRMRQAAQNIPQLLDQMAGPADAEGNRTGLDAEGKPVGVLSELRASGIPLVNQIAQWGAKKIGQAGPLKQYNILANKLAMEQAFLMSGGNAPPDQLYKHLLEQYAPSDNPENVMAALSTVDETVRGYQESIGQTGPVTPTSPYVPGARDQNPVGGKSWGRGAQPAAGSVAPPRAGYVRIVHPDGTVADYPKGKPIPAGWRAQ